MDGIEGMDALRAELAAIRDRTQNMEPALLRGGLVLLKAAFDRIDAGGPGWPPNKSRTPILHKTGRLQSSLTVASSDHIANITGNTIEVGTNVQYALWLQTGTEYHARGSTYSAFGRKANVQGPRARDHHGMPARPFLFIDQQASDKIADIFAKFIMTGKAA